MLGEANGAASEAVHRWLGEFESALSRGDRGTIAGLFHPDGYWRDLLAFTWNIATVRGAQTIAAALLSHAGKTAAIRFEIDPHRTPPSRRATKRRPIAAIWPDAIRVRSSSISPARNCVARVKAALIASAE